MQTVFLSLAALACPIGMGVMMWFMGRGMRAKQEQKPEPVSLEALREEHRRMGDQIERRQGEDTLSRSGS
jgi:hypothetical protein